MRADYTHVLRYVRLGRRIDHLAVHRHDGDETYTYWDWRFLWHLPQAIQFLRLLMEFRRRYDDLKERCVAIGQAAAIRSDPALTRLYHQPALEFIEQHKINDLARWYLAPGIHGTTFASLHDITAFTLLLGALPVLIPAYEFTPRLDRLTAGFGDAIVIDTATALASYGARYHIETKRHGTLTTRHVVIATPTDAAKRLLRLPAIKRPVSSHQFHVAGTLRDPYHRADIHLFSETDPTLAIAKQEGGTFLVSSQQPHPDIGCYFTTWRVLEHRHWNPAFHLVGDTLLECEQGPGLYLVGDHNIVGLEDAYLTGLHAANRIIHATASPRLASQERIRSVNTAAAPNPGALTQ